MSAWPHRRCSRDRTTAKFTGDKKAAIEDIRQALYASKIISYAQGYMLMKQVSDAL